MKKLTILTFALFLVVSFTACSSGDNNPPANDAPVNDPPANDAPVNDPPVNDPPVNDPPVNDPPVNDPPANDPPVYDPPADVPPVSGFVPNTDASYVLQTSQSKSRGECFDSNFVAPESDLGGASHMSNCQNVTSQIWRFIDLNNGYYQLQSLFVESVNQCLESNRFDAASGQGGAAFMVDCQGATGQVWSLLDRGNDTFQLQSLFREEENECLEGNQISDTATLGGAAFMMDCEEVSGQIWSATLASEFQYPVEAPLQYQIGDVGPGGGIVFYLDPDSGGTTGLEAAPEDQSNDVLWCTDLNDIAEVDSINDVTVADTHSGAHNTPLIAAECGASSAAGIASAYMGPDGTTADWFLPNKEELNQMYINIGPGGDGLNEGGFANDDDFWSSSEIGGNIAWIQFYFNGDQYGSHKHLMLSVRAVRAF